jgi:hypothetical protein
VPEVNKDWIAEQLAAAKVKVGSGKAILRLLETWSELPKLSDAMLDEVLTVFPKLAKGFTLKEEEKESDYDWRPLQPGNIVLGDVVRVKADAFRGDIGPMHNSRVGKVIAVRYGDVIVNSTDGKSPELKGVHYSPYKLEKRVKKAQQ